MKLNRLQRKGKEIVGGETDGKGRILRNKLLVFCLRDILAVYMELEKNSRINVYIPKKFSKRLKLLKKKKEKKTCECNFSLLFTPSSIDPLFKY